MKNLNTLLISTLFFLSINVISQDVYIPDANLKNALLNMSYLNSNGDNEIQVSEAETIDSLSINNLGISSLVGIEAFVNLKYLDCHSNYTVEEIDVSNMLDLEYLDCKIMDLTSINIANNLLLTHLSLYGNDIAQLDVTNHTELTLLECGNNNLTELNVSNNTLLVTLALQNNQVSTLDVSNNLELMYLNCDNNPINTIDVSNNLELTHLSCYGCGLTNLDVTNNQNLWSLSFGVNQVSSIDLSNNTDLRYLNMWENLFTNIDFSNNTLLRTIGCSRNQLSEIDVSNNPYLQRLTCYENNIGILDLTNNIALQRLRFYGNNTTDIDISNCHNLRMIECQDNLLDTLDLSNNPNMEDLYCFNNNIAYLDVSNCISLEYLSCSNNNITALDISNNPNIERLYCSNNNLITLNVRNGNNHNFAQYNASNNPDLTCIIVDDPIWSDTHWSPSGPYSYFSTGCSNTIAGNVLIDDNCIIEGAEQAVCGIIVKTEPSNNFGITSSLGAYSMKTDTGTYIVEPITTNPLIIPECPNPYQHIANFDSTGIDTMGLNFFYQVIECPYLTVDINSNMRRRCFQNNTYVHYCNEGFAYESFVQLYVQFPEYVNFISADYPYTINSNGDYVFDIGNLSIGECGDIHIVDSVSCIEEITGLTQCTKAWLTPANDCVNGLDTVGMLLWDHSSINVEGQCLSDTAIQFVITNTGDYGDGDMELASEYRIYADNELSYTGNFQLLGGEELGLQVSANGQTIRLEADQHPNHPGNSHPNAIIEACGTGDISLGFVNSAPMDDEDAEIEIDCKEIVDSFDPNDKTVSPTGLTESNYVLPGTLLDYMIRFQNTGTDVAYDIVIVDTLSNYYDLSTIQWGVSSHSYTVDVSGQDQAIIRFTFDNIFLPDSSSDELNSHGFVKFKIAAFDTLINGTEIKNFADIYFDYNSPIRTNTAITTISDTTLLGTPIEVDVVTNIKENELGGTTVSPNPFSEHLNIVFEKNSSYEIKVLNVLGKEIQTTIFEGKKVTLITSELPRGIYIVQVTSQDGIRVEKIIKQ
jgi:Leucine-rich repeat (LRR) protein